MRSRPAAHRHLVFLEPYEFCGGRAARDNCAFERVHERGNDDTVDQYLLRDPVLVCACVSKRAQNNKMRHVMEEGQSAT